jgi:hypothetical protein
MSGATQHETGHQYSTAQKGENLLHEAPGGFHPTFALIFGKPRLEHETQTVQEHTARIVPETEATEYDKILLALAPKYLRTDACDTNTAIAPAIKKAGMRQVRTCSRAYSCSIMKASNPDCRIIGWLHGT